MSDERSEFRDETLGEARERLHREIDALAADLGPEAVAGVRAMSAALEDRIAVERDERLRVAGILPSDPKEQ